MENQVSFLTYVRCIVIIFFLFPAKSLCCCLSACS